MMPRMMPAHSFLLYIVVVKDALHSRRRRVEILTGVNVVKHAGWKITAIYAEIEAQIRQTVYSFDGALVLGEPSYLTC
jgi:hypothetical protein